MRKVSIPPEMDTLLWALAEEENPKAFTEFERRYPQYRAELARRREMVKGLRKENPLRLAVPNSAPKFEPKKESEVRVPVVPVTANRTAVTVVAGLVLVTLTLASYLVFSSPEPVGKDESTVSVPDSKPAAYEERWAIEQDPVPPPSPVTKTQQLGDLTNAPPDPLPVSLRPQTFRVEGAKLSEALQMLGAQSEMKIVLAPGMEDVSVDADYIQSTAQMILEDLGRRYGFTAFDQGDGSVLIIPATDPGRGARRKPYEETQADP